MIILKKYLPLLKYNFLVLIVFASFSNPLFSEDIKNNESYVQSKGTLNYNYYGFPFFIEGGYEYRTNSSQVFFPLIGASFENGLYMPNMFVTARTRYRYKRFHIQLSFKQGLITPYGLDYKYENLERLGNFTIGYAFKNVEISYDLGVGDSYAEHIAKSEISNTFRINNNININALLYTDAASTLSLNTGIGATIMPNNDQYSYSFWVRMPYTFFHYWGELGIMSSIAYSEYFEDSRKDYRIGSDYLGSLMMTSIAKDMDITPLYNFLTSVHLEYKFFLRFLPDGFSSIYIVAYGNIGYGTEIGNEFNNDTLLYTAGGGIGYNLFGMVPMQITLGVDRHNNLVINYSISAVIHTF